MYPSLSPGEYVLFDRLAYRWALPEQGDIILAVRPMDSRFLMIKRVLAMPGQTVESRGHDLLVDGDPWATAMTPGPFAPVLSGEYRFQLKGDEYFLIGDDPARSTDSRQLGPFPESAIKGKAYLVYWPLSAWRTLAPPPGFSPGP